MAEVIKITSMDGGVADKAALLEAIKRMSETEDVLKVFYNEDELDFSSAAFGRFFKAFRTEPEKHETINGYRNDGLAPGICAIQIGDMDSERAWVSIAHGQMSTIMTVADYITVEIVGDMEWVKDFESNSSFLFK